ncbi:zf-HC2 domain-containing protein [Nocardioides sp.]|uniref:zf-HC2 domain-containing protein n=1 Tax=Nocardioides sp. TaxID=35761 RepID=UPI0035115742
MWRELLGVHALGRLEEPEATALEEHLAGCAPCRDEVASLAGLGRRLTDLRPRLALDRLDPGLGEQEVLPPGGEERLLAAVRAAGPTAGTGAGRAAVAGGAGPVAPRWRRPTTWVAAAAVLAAVGGAGVVGYRLAPEPPVVPLEAVAVAPAAGITARADLVPHTWGVEVKLVATGFTAGEAYRVRILDAAGRRFDAGEFVGVGDVTMRCNLNSAVLRPQARGFEVLDAAGRVVLTSAFDAPA